MQSCRADTDQFSDIELNMALDIAFIISLENAPREIQLQPQCCVLADPANITGSAVNSMWYSKGNPLDHWLDGKLVGGKCEKFLADNADGEPDLAVHTEVRMEEYQTQPQSSEQAQR